jgi:hypothetical protein
MRPGEPARSTLRDWVAVCRGCGAAAPDLTALPDSTRDVVRSSAYVDQTGAGSEETLPFRRWAMLCQAQGDRGNEAEALLQGAWAADDAAAMSEAAALRQRVADLWDATLDIETSLRRIDVLRRAGQFEAATSWAALVGRRPLEETARAIVTFQQARIAERDIGRHLISSAIPPPAHAPHVARGKRPTPGFWSRLFRRR